MAEWQNAENDESASVAINTHVYVHAHTHGMSAPPSHHLFLQHLSTDALHCTVIRPLRREWGGRSGETVEFWTNKLRSTQLNTLMIR